jgi:putative FmdB family regulatory protein
MPTYEYRCEACGHEFEKFQMITASPVRKCPECGKLKVKRLLSTGGALIFKGSGFYSTDYRSRSYKEGAKKDAAPAASKCDTCPKDGKPCPAKKEK